MSYAEQVISRLLYNNSTLIFILLKRINYLIVLYDFLSLLHNIILNIDHTGVHQTKLSLKKLCPNIKIKFAQLTNIFYFNDLCSLKKQC